MIWANCARSGPSPHRPIADGEQLAADVFHGADQNLETLVVHEVAAAQDKTFAVLLPDSRDGGYLALAEPLEVDAVGDHVAAVEVIRQYRRCAYILHRGGDYGGTPPQGDVQKGFEHVAQKSFAHRVAVVGHHKSSLVTAGQVAEDGGRIRQMDVDELRPGAADFQ